MALVAAAASLAVGARALPLTDVMRALLAFDPSRPGDVILWEMRMIRTMTGLTTGAALAAAGLIMQQISRNPLADPGILGVNAGAALAVVTGVWLAGWSDPARLSALSVTGAGLAALAVFALGGGARAADRAAILRLTLAGVAISALCLAFVSAVVLLDQGTRDIYRFWTFGSVAQADAAQLLRLAPLILGGLGLSFLMARRLDALALGSETAQSFGVPVGWTVAAGLGAVACLAGGSVALAGPLGFVGLIVPHLARALVGPSLLPGLLVACPLGGALLLGCDVLGRVLDRPAELQAGLVLALIGGPVFLALIGRVAR